KFLPPAAAASPASNAPAAAAKGLLGAKIVVGLAAVGLGVWSYVDLARPAPEPAVPMVVPAPQPAPVEAPPARPEPAPAGASAPPAPVQLRAPREAKAKRAKKPQPAPPASPYSTLAQETALLQLAAVELRAGQLDRARATLAEFARRFPDSPLNADRERLERRLMQAER
ncbi:MAG TPA: tetratricopeptide repeat protein, partial [Polyangiales bacterium]|nr:tetratricopeptide repeat protein [Polyangiales bacterium]